MPKPMLFIIDGADKLGKCLAEGSLVSMVDGSLKKIEDVKVGDEILCVNKNLKIDKTVVEATASQKQECFKITLRDGRWIKASADHPFLTVNGWKKLSELKIGDYIATPRVLPVFNKVEDIITEVEAELIGMFLGDGCTSSGNFGIYVGDYETELIARFTELVYKFDPTLRISECHDKRTKALRLRVCFNPPSQFLHIPNSLAELFKKIGLWGLTGADKFVPGCVINGSNKIIIACLRGLWNTDGNIYNSKLRNNVSIDFSNKSEKMIYQVQHMLLRLGILSYVRYKHALCSTSGKRFDHWKMSVMTTQSKIKFLESVLIDSLALDRLKHNLTLKCRGNNFDLIPKEVFHGIEMPCNKKEGKRVYRKSDRLTHDSSREETFGIGIRLSNDKLIGFGSSDILWDNIKSSSNLGILKTFDLQTTEQNFIANNIVVHNSTQAKLMEGRLGFKYLKQPNDQGKFGFIRDVVLNNPDLSILQRQLAHVFSAINDSFEYFDGGSDLVMDRSFLSTLVYGKIMGLSKNEYILLFDLNIAPFMDIFKKYYPVILIFTADKPFGEADNTYYEKFASWSDIKHAYEVLYNGIGGFLPSPFFEYTAHSVNVTGKSIEEVFSEINERLYFHRFIGSQSVDDAD